MKRLASLSFILVAGVLAACMPPVEEVAATYFAQETIEAATATPLPPTDTPLPTDIPPPTGTPLPPTETPLPTATPINIEDLGVREGPVLFEDDFETDFALRWTIEWGWWLVVDEEGTGGNKVFTTDAGGSMPPLQYSSVWRDFQVDLRLRIADLPQASSAVVIFFRIPTYSICPSYQFWVNDSEIGLGYVDEACNSIELDLSTDTPALNQWTNVRIAAVGDNLLVYLDDTLALNATHDALPNGSVRLEIWEGAEAYFDDVRIVQLVPEE